MQLSPQPTSSCDVPSAEGLDVRKPTLRLSRLLGAFDPESGPEPEPVAESSAREVGVGVKTLEVEPRGGRQWQMACTSVLSGFLST